MKPADKKRRLLYLGILCALILIVLFTALNVFVYRTVKQTLAGNRQAEIQSQDDTRIQTFELQTEEPANSGMQSVGTEEFGYVTIPDTWVKFKDLDGGTDFQYSNPEGTSIITLNTISLDGLTEEQKEQFNTKSAAQNIWYNLQNSDVTDIQGAQVALGPYDAYQVYGNFISEDYSLESGIVCWIFKSGDGVYHFISAEAAWENLKDVVSYVEESYTLTLPGSTV